MQSWPEPLSFITCKSERFQLNQQVVALLQQIDKPIAIVCIAGSYRTGKSYLMNRLVGKQTGFRLGNTLDAETKGIWVWYRYHPNDASRGLLVMDTEGLDDPHKGDATNDLQILTLSILLSSTFIYNAVGKADATLIDKMEFVTEISNHVRVKTNVSNDSNFDSIFPQFVLVCRDKTLELKMDDKEVTADEYMERVMLPATKKKKFTARETTRNETKIKLRRYFPQRKCFFFVRPAKTDADMLRLEELTESDIQESFLTESDKFCSYVNDTTTVKKLDTQSVNGRIFVHLAKIYTDAMNDDAIPCIENTLTLVATAENTKLVDECAAKYNECMSKLKLPMEEDELKKWHEQNHKMVVDYFASKVFLNENIEYHSKMQILLDNTYMTYVQKNWETSDKLCNEVLDKLFAPIQKKLNDGFYNCRKGYEKFSQDSEDLQREYISVPNKGVLADVKLEKFLIRLQETQNSILKADKELTKKDKELEEERLRREKAQSELKNQTEQVRQLTQHEQLLISSHKQQIQAVEKKHQEDRDENQRKNEQLNRAREAEQRRLIEEKLAEEAQQWQMQLEEERQRVNEERQRLQDTLNELQQRISGPSQDQSLTETIVRTAISVAGFAASSVLPMPVPARLFTSALVTAAANYF